EIISGGTSPKEFPSSLFCQIFSPTHPGRIVSSQSQGEYDLIFCRLNLLPVSGRIPRRRTTP
ncbi:hypothetical protein K0M31_000445, partial [Melipona bicolor]